MRKVEYWFNKHGNNRTEKSIGIFHRWIEEDGETKALLESDEGRMFTVTYRQFMFIDSDKEKASCQPKKNIFEKLYDKRMFYETVERGEPYYIRCVIPFESHIPNILESLIVGKLTPIKYAFVGSHYIFVLVTGKYEGAMGIDIFADTVNIEKYLSQHTFIDCN